MLEPQLSRLRCMTDEDGFHVCDILALTATTELVQRLQRMYG